MTLLHPDPHQPATVDALALPWDPSPAPGVERKRIERTGGEVARLTSLVRYAPGSAFPAHGHGGGEEYLVLEGVFSDEHGDHGVGSYVRNGVGSRHAPHTDPGCIILVKLWWMHPEETGSVAIDTAAATGWSPVGPAARRVLHDGLFDRTELLRVPAGATLRLPRRAGLEAFVVEGAVRLDGQPLGRWGWARRPGHGPLALEAETDSVLWLKRGHLESPPPLPA